MIRSIPSTFFGVILGITATIGVASATNHSAHADRLVSEARSELAEIQALIPAARHSTSAMRQLDAKADELSHTLKSLDRTIDAMQTPPAPRVVSGHELRQIESAIAREDFSDDQMRVLRSAAQGRYFTSAQVLQLMNHFTFDDDKVEAAVVLFPKVVDQQNWYTVYAGLTFGSDKAELRRRTM